MLRLALGGVMVLVVSLAAPVAASVKSGEDVSVGSQSISFAQQRDKVEADLADGTTYAEILPQDREKVRHALARMQAHLDAAGSVEALGDDARVAVFNDQEVINTILKQARDDSRVICRREIGTGTRMKRNSCNTVAELRRRREAAQDGISSHQLGLLESHFINK